ncbi:MAG: Crp/Fnr family transcriptional regulator [bacterium]|nr:Crp/Fnr family transcriptional regulator [bacterium]
MDKNLHIEKFFFNTAPIWQQVPTEINERLLATSISAKYKKNTTIVYDYEYAAGLYCIKKGFVKIYSINALGGEDIVFILGKGLVFGVSPLLNNEKCGVNATAMEDCEIEIIPKEIIKLELEKSIELNQAFIFYLSQLVKMLNIKLLDFMRKPLAERVALTLLILDKKLSLNGTLVFSREDLANFMGTAIESLVRQLKKLKTENLISVKGRKITIIDYVGLTKIASETP